VVGFDGQKVVSLKINGSSPEAADELCGDWTSPLNSSCWNWHIGHSTPLEWLELEEFDPSASLTELKLVGLAET